jgi:hypothetical protein
MLKTHVLPSGVPGMLEVGVLPLLRQLAALLALGLLVIAQAAAAAAWAARCGAIGDGTGL